MNLSTFVYMNLSSFVYMNLSTFVYMNLSTFVHMNFSTFAYMNLSTFVYINLSTFVYMNLSAFVNFPGVGVGLTSFGDWKPLGIHSFQLSREGFSSKVLTPHKTLLPDSRFMWKDLSILWPGQRRAPWWRLWRLGWWARRRGTGWSPPHSFIIFKPRSMNAHSVTEYFRYFSH